MGIIRNALRRFSARPFGYKVGASFVVLTAFFAFIRVVVYPFRDYLDDVFLGLFSYLGKFFSLLGKGLKAYFGWVGNVFVDNFWDGLIVIMVSISLLILGFWAALRFWRKL